MEKNIKCIIHAKIKILLGDWDNKAEKNNFHYLTLEFSHT